jgi:hypothetical protein
MVVDLEPSLREVDSFLECFGFAIRNIKISGFRGTNESVRNPHVRENWRYFLIYIL